MNEVFGLENFNIETISLTNFFLGIILNLFLALFIRYTYIKHSASVSNKLIVADIFPVFSLSLFLIVITIKSSLVLSLGLVGALSIIRFSVEPEDISTKNLSRSMLSLPRYDCNQFFMENLINFTILYLCIVYLKVI